MPCENCAALGTSCFYSVAGRQGRPRGSRSRRTHSSNNISSTGKTWRAPASKPGSAPQTPPSNSDSASAMDSMLDLPLDGFDLAPSYDLPMNDLHDDLDDPGLVNMYLAPDRGSLGSFDPLSSLESSSLGQSAMTSERLPSMSPVRFDQPRPEHQREPVDEQQLEIQLHALFYEHNHQGQPEPRKASPSRCLPPGDCDCIPRLSSLLHDLKRTMDDKMPPVGLDEVLSRVSDALTQWSAVAQCQRCQDHDGHDDEGETLLLAALSMRRVVAQLSGRGFLRGSTEFREGDVCDKVKLRVGAFQVTGSDRTMLLGVLRTITVRKLDAAVTTMQSTLRTKQARQGEEQRAILHHVESILKDLAKAIKSQ